MGLEEEPKPSAEPAPGLDFYNQDDDEPQQLVDVEDDALLLERGKPDPPKPKIDLFNDPLLPEEPPKERDRGSEKKKRVRSGSFGAGDKKGFEDSEEDIAFEDLEPDEKYEVLQQLYEQYQLDPDNFPEDQRLLLEHELKDIFDRQEGEDDEMDDERLQVPGNINFPEEMAEKPSPEKEDEDDEAYMQEIIKQQEEAQNERMKYQEEMQDPDDEPEHETDSEQARRQQEEQDNIV